MSLIKRATDVLGGFEVGKGGGIVGGLANLNPFRGWRQYSVVASYADPAGVELPIIRIRKSSGPPTDTREQVVARVGQSFVPKTWPYPAAAGAEGYYPTLAWYFLDPATLAYVAGPLLPLGNSGRTGFAGFIDDAFGDKAQVTEHVVQWFEHTPPTGPYIGILVSREPSETFPLWVSGHPVEHVTDRLTASGDPFIASTATAVQAAVGSELQLTRVIVDADESPQDIIDAMAEAFGFTVRRSETTGEAEFVYWRYKPDANPAETLTLNDIREEGGPTFELSDATRLTTVRVMGQVIRPWVPGLTMQVSRRSRRFLGIKIPQFYYAPKPDPTGTDKPASGLTVSTAEITYQYSSDGTTPDADTFGAAEADIDVPGMPGVLNQVAGGASPINFELWASGVARQLFDTHARGRQMATFPALRGTDADGVGIGDAITLDLAHLPNAQLGQSPTSQRGGARPFRIIGKTQDLAGPALTLADEGTGVALAIDPELRLYVDGAPNGNQVLSVQVNPAEDLAAAGAWLELQVRSFANGDPLLTADPGFRYGIFDTTLWPETGSTPHTVHLDEFPPGHEVIVRARAWLVGGGAGAWSLWYGQGGPITGPQTTLSNLRITNVTDEGAQLDWSYDESPQVGDVRVRIRDITGGVLGSWSAVTGSPFAPGTETTTLTGYLSGHQYEVEVQLQDGSAVAYGDVLVGVFFTGGGKISGLSVSSVDASSAKLNWTNTDAGRQVMVEIKKDTDAVWSIYQNLAAGSNRLRLVGLIPSTNYEVQVSIHFTDGAGGAPLTDSFTTAAASVQLEVPLTGGPFWDTDPLTGLRYDGRFGLRLHAHPNNLLPHEIVVKLAVETAVASDTPGTYVEQSPFPASPGVTLWFIADAPNDGKKRYMTALSRDPNGSYTDSIETIVETAIPWSATGAQPPAGGGIPNAWTLTHSALAAAGTVTGSFSIPDGAEMYLVASNAKDVRVRLYRDSATVTSDVARAVTSSLWPAGLLFDAEILAADSHSISLPPPQRIRFLLADHESRVVWYRLDSLESGTEDFMVTLSYFAASHSPLA